MQPEDHYYKPWLAGTAGAQDLPAAIVRVHKHPTPQAGQTVNSKNVVHCKGEGMGFSRDRRLFQQRVCKTTAALSPAQRHTLMLNYTRICSIIICKESFIQSSNTNGKHARP
jgi:hypothetical protein